MDSLGYGGQSEGVLKCLKRPEQASANPKERIMRPVIQDTLRGRHARVTDV